MNTFDITRQSLRVNKLILLLHMPYIDDCDTIIVQQFKIVCNCKSVVSPLY